jgi:predicted kinase
MTLLPAIVISGPPASGKTTLAAALAPHLGAAVLDIDVATGPLTSVISELIGADDLSDPRLAHLTRTARYETLLALAEDNLRVGTPVIVVAPFTAERELRPWQIAADRLGAHTDQVVLVWLHLPSDELRERLVARGASRDQIKIEDVAAFLAALDPRPPVAPHLALDARQPPAGLVQAILSRLTR